MRALRRTALLCLLTPVCAGALLSGGAGAAPTTPSTPQARSKCTPLAEWGLSEPAVAERVVTLANEHRARLGLRRLVVSPTLTRAATWKALHMAKYNYFTHPDLGVGPGDGRPFWVRATDCGYRRGTGENIAAGFESQGDASRMVGGWLHSPPHRANLESTNALATGVGVATDARGATYWVQMFGTVADSSTPQPVSAVTDSGLTIVGQPVLLPVLDNDGPLVALHSIANHPAHGTVQIVGRQPRYTPKAGFVGIDRFTYIAAGLDGAKAQAEVTITVSPMRLTAALSAYRISVAALANQHLSYSVTGRGIVRYRLYQLGQARALQVSSPHTLTNSSLKVSLPTVFGQTKHNVGQYRLVVEVASGPTKTLQFRLT